MMSDAPSGHEALESANSGRDSVEHSELYPPTDEAGGLVLATRLPGDADELGEHRLGWDAITAWGHAGEVACEWERETGAPAAARPEAVEPGVLWIHLDRTKPRAAKWIREAAGLDAVVAEALLAEDTRPSFQAIGEGLLVILRGVNMNPGAEPDELISVRMWLEPNRVISLRQYRFQTLRELRQRCQRGEGPATSGAFLSAVARGLALRMGPSAANLESMVDEIEEAMLREANVDPRKRSDLAEVRRQAIGLRRFLAPQRDALRELAALGSSLLSAKEAAEVRLAAEQVARVCDGLEEARDRAAVTQDEMRARHEARVGRTVYLLTLVATVALPLTLVSGLLGMNVGGIPLAESGLGFAIVCGVLGAVALAEILWFILARWI